MQPTGRTAPDSQFWFTPMLAVLRARTWSRSTWNNSQTLLQQPWKLGFSTSPTTTVDGNGSKCPLDLQEIEKVLTDVKADDVKKIPVPKHCDWADFMVLATGRSTWHVKNIAQALIYKAGSLLLFFLTLYIFHWALWLIRLKHL